MAFEHIGDAATRVVDKAKTARGLWQEYLRVDEWARTDDEKHGARTAIRCCATRLGVYNEFVALDK
jgi:hypothetical protein